MGYANLNGRMQHEADAARIAELERQLAREKESHATEGAARGRNEQAANHVTVEKTSKKLKVQLLSSWICLFLGVIVATSSVEAGAVLMAVGIFAIVYTKISIWWHHG